MTKELIDHDVYSGLSTWLEFDELQPTKFHIHYTQDVGRALEANKEAYNDDEAKKHGIKNGWWHVAHIPDVVVLKWRSEGIDVFNKDHTNKIKQKLADPEYRYLRTSPGEIGR